MMSIQWKLVVFTAVFVLNQFVKSQSNLVSPSILEDDIHYVFKWPGHLFNLEDDMKQNIDMIDITTNNFEKYKCAIPVDLTDEELKNLEANESNFKEAKIAEENPIKTSSLLDSIYSKKFCSYRIESYWIYELCHGQYVKQYHETKNAGKRVVNEEYFLGYYNADKQEPDYFKEKGNKNIPNIHWRTLDGQRVATYGVKYTDGTSCEVLANTLREITVFYACDENGNDNIATFEEVSSCVYEMIVVSKWICSHPAYKLPEKNKKTISCYSMDDSPTQPEELEKIEQEKSLNMASENKVKMTDSEGSTFIVHYKTIDDPGELNVHSETTQQAVLKEPQQPSDQSIFNNLEDKLFNHYQSINDAEKKMINDFLTGDECLNGGQGWWKYEICLGKHVMQYHEDEQTKKRNNVLLGTWDAEKHKKWIEKNPNKRPLSNKNERTILSLYYSDGDMCENKKRFVEVRLRCIKPSEKAHAISLYLIEPSTCEYMLAVESTWLCDYIDKIDNNEDYSKKSSDIDD